MTSPHDMTRKVLDMFAEISKIPRRSKNEDQICDWLKAWAEQRGLEVRTDSVRNILIAVPGTKGIENAPIVVLQGHVDMVCEKTPESSHDFSKDPIELVYDGEWLRANQTTLGADNGIALAMGLVAASDPAVAHPPLELLFTVDEETGLTGANAIEPGFIKGKILLNLDSEDEGVLTVGCAGGMDTLLTLDLEHENAPAGHQAFDFVAGGMTGGHSGVDIIEMRANALRVMVRAIEALLPHGVKPFDLKGGSAHNAIPRDARAGLFIPAGAVDAVKASLDAQQSLLRAEFANTDPNLKLVLTPRAEAPKRVMSAAGARKLVDFVMAIPHGVAAMSTDIPGLVETSNNEAILAMVGESVTIKTSQRSSVMSRMRALTLRIEGIARLAGGRAESGNGYPSWQPNMDSPLLARCVRIYEEMYGKKPVVEVIHAGLECGIIGAKNDGMDMISLGPTVKNPHSPDEKIHIGSIGLVWDYLLKVMASFAD
ncbi:MAG: hypothetical protein AUK47_05440 [Deltaproteobacteria bacterium CG2_30_63_29]|nr:MAG: hypothetical protein AUK47_05440 [Deltaproteobacteria bacterium CG2_30_63_29]PIW02531.1 MAG: aminoacyl-histidine dipeptidase [Deltaproteobacteria bacterium CG17_big_fil_post_rev_8_21_14_2_50_63_7]PJB33608.1 MAG: aminoacyl-histidine dipeptidase [Deltaproteobacteria bacterium CG_4_9_14_3_um_filter_63_12]